MEYPLQDEVYKPATLDSLEGTALDGGLDASIEWHHASCVVPKM